VPVESTRSYEKTPKKLAIKKSIRPYVEKTEEGSQMTEVFDLQEASAYLKIAKSTLYKYVRLGEVPSFRVGRVLRFKKDVLDEWMRQQTDLQTSAIKKRNK